MIQASVIPHKDQRYNTVGDWQYDADGYLIVKVSDTYNEESNILIAIHEIIEAFLCKANGVTEQLVDAFDKENEDHPDPGSIPGCPYYMEHMFALMIERQMAAMMQVNWTSHEYRIENITE